MGNNSQKKAQKAQNISKQNNNLCFVNFVLFLAIVLF